MKPRHQLSKAAIELIKRFEGYRRAAALLPDGRYTIGYGHTKTARAGVEIDERDAEALLMYDLLSVTSEVNDQTFTPLTQNQFDALVSFAFNIGIANFRQSSVLRRVNEGNLLQAAAAIEMWRKSEFEGERIVVDALIRRRAAEKALFLTPADGYVPAPSPVLPPRVDYELAVGAPRESAHRLVTPLEGETTPRSEGMEPVRPMPEEDRSPVTAAAEAFAARLRAIEPDEVAAPKPAEDESEAPPTTPPAAAVFSPSKPPEPAVAPEVMESVVEQPEPSRPILVLTPPEPQDAEFEPLSDIPAEAPLEIDPDTATLPFDAPDDEEPLTLAAARANRREPTSYIAQDTFPRFETIAKPVRFTLQTLVALFVGGVALLAVALVWGANSSGAASTITWVIGLAGVVAIVAAFYLFVTRVGGTED